MSELERMKAARDQWVRLYETTLHARLAEVEKVLEELVDIVQDAIEQQSTKNMDSFTLQPARAALASTKDGTRTFRLGDRVTKIKGSKWTGLVVGTYRTSLTPEGYAVESETEVGSVQIYPVAALASAEEEEKKDD